MTEPVVYLHVGAPKTGTTYLQDKLFRNRDRLAADGVLYAADRFDAHFLAALDLLGKPWGGLRKQARGRWKQLAERVSTWEGTAIISAEVLASATAEQAAEALEDLSPATVHVVYSARDLARQVPAEWQENVKHRKTDSYADFLQALVAEDEDAKGRRWFWAVQNWPSVLSRWGATLPPERVHLLTVPPPGGPVDQLWERFRELCGIDPASCPEPSDRGNPSLGIAETSLVRAINERVNDGVLPNHHYRHLVREVIGHRTLARRGDVQRVTLPPWLNDWATSHTQTWRRQVSERGYDIVGDLDELWPGTWGDQDESGWRDPDQPEPDAWRDTALDALVALLKEGARLRDDVAALDDRVNQLSEQIAAQADQLAASTQRAAAAEAAIRERQEIPAAELVKRTVVELGDRSRSVDKALQVYRRVRRRRA